MVATTIAYCPYVGAVNWSAPPNECRSHVDRGTESDGQEASAFPEEQPVVLGSEADAAGTFGDLADDGGFVTGSSQLGYRGQAGVGADHA